MAGYKAWWRPKEGYPDEQFFAQLNPKMSDFPKQKLKGEICRVGERLKTFQATF